MTAGADATISQHSALTINVNSEHLFLMVERIFQNINLLNDSVFDTKNNQVVGQAAVFLAFKIYNLV